MLNTKELPHDFNILLKNPAKIKEILEQFPLHSFIYISLNKPARNIKSELEINNIKTDNIYFIDGISRYIKSFNREKNCIYLTSLDKLKEINLAIEKHAKEIGYKNKFLILDSLSILSESYTEKTILKFMNFLKIRLRDLNIRGIIISNNDSISNKIYFDKILL